MTSLDEFNPMHPYEKTKKLRIQACYDMNTCTCDNQKATYAPFKGKEVDGERCTSAFDYGWCTGCRCSHDNKAEPPANAKEACQHFHPDKFCKKRPTQRGCSWCDCCDFMKI